MKGMVDNEIMIQNSEMEVIFHLSIVLKKLIEKLAFLHQKEYRDYGARKFYHMSILAFAEIKTWIYG